MAEACRPLDLCQDMGLWNSGFVWSTAGWQEQDLKCVITTGAGSVYKQVILELRFHVATGACGLLGLIWSSDL